MICTAAYAIAHLWSYHTGNVLNNDNYGAGLECDQGGYAVQVGGFRNSFDKPSFYAVGGYDIGTTWQAGVFAGATTGYTSIHVPGYVAPHVEWTLAGARFGYTLDRYRVQVAVTPPMRGSPSMAHLMVGIRI